MHLHNASWSTALKEWNLPFSQGFVSEQQDYRENNVNLFFFFKAREVFYSPVGEMGK